MQASLFFLLVVLAAYLIGAIPSGLIVGRLLGRDPMKSGSGKTGANNTFQTAGAAAGATVLVLDLAKGAAAALIPRFIAWPDDAWAGIATGAAGAAAIIGHNWSLWVRLFAGKWGGGRGIMTAFGAMLTVSIWVALAALVVGAVLMISTRYMAWGAIGGALAGSAAATVLGLAGGMSMWLVPGAVVWGLLVVVGFHDNIGRLLRGTEPRLGSKHPAQS